MESQLDIVTKEKMKKNLVYVGIFSVIMLFAGLTSAYIVLMGDSFWLKYPMPDSFLISTCLVLISSVSFFIAIKSIQKNNKTGLKLFMSLTVMLGVLFVFFQFRGYSELVQNGFYAANNHLLVVDGRYGDYYSITYDDQKIYLNGNDYLLGENNLNEQQLEDLKAFVQPFTVLKQGELNLYPYWKANYKLFYKNNRIINDNGFLLTPTQDTLEYVDLHRLKLLAENIINDRGDFFAKGKYGVDFEIYYKDEKLDYYAQGESRYLTYKGQPLSASLQNKALQAADSASSFLYVITFVHLIHILIALLYLFKISISSFSGKFDSKNHIALKTGSIFWHFLGLLWVYLLLFLIYIH